MNLEDILKATKLRLELAKKKLPLQKLMSLLVTWEGQQNDKAGILPFEKSIKGQNISFICEIKKASPIKGLLVSNFPYVEIAKEYEKSGAQAISVLTEPKYFKGSLAHLKKISQTVKIPILRKDFIIDEYQIYESKFYGAHGILLITSLLSEDTLKRYLGICETLGLSALVETHNADDIALAIKVGARVIGINNRNLKTFAVNLKNCLDLRASIPEDIICVAESGIQSREDVLLFESMKIDALLIGEALIKATDRRKMLSYLKGIEDPAI